MDPIQKIKELVNIDRDPEEEFSIIQPLGDGSYGCVFKALKKQTGEILAVKLIPLNQFDQIDLCIKEMEILASCSSPYIVGYSTTYYKDDYLWIAMEYMSAGSVKDIIRLNKQNLNENTIGAILHSVLEALNYLHSNKMIHRDIKADNILLNEFGQAKMADFGVSAQLLSTYASQKSVIGTPFWMSPEILSKNKYNNKTDIWSVGITAIEMAEKEPPYSKYYTWVAMKKIKENPPKGLTNPENWSNEFNDFVKQCLIVDYNERPDAQTLLKHPFIIKGKQNKKLLQVLVQENKQQIEHSRITKVKNLKDNLQEESVIKSITQNSDSIQARQNYQSESEDDEENTGTVIIKNNHNNKKENQVQSELEKFVKQYKEINKEIDKKKEIDKELNIYQENVQKLKQIEEALNLDPKVKTKDVEKTVTNLEKQYEEELIKIKQKYEPVIDTLNQYIDLKKKIKIAEKQLKEFGVELKVKKSVKKKKSKQCFEKQGSKLHKKRDKKQLIFQIKMQKIIIKYE